MTTTSQPIDVPKPAAAVTIPALTGVPNLDIGASRRSGDEPAHAARWLVTLAQHGDPGAFKVAVQTLTAFSPWGSDALATAQQNPIVRHREVRGGKARPPFMKSSQ